MILSVNYTGSYTVDGTTYVPPIFDDQKSLVFRSFQYRIGSLKIFVFVQA